MKIRKVKEQPMKLHTKEATKLHIKTKGRKRAGKRKIHKVRKSPFSGIKQKVETSDASL